jgi:diadenosine tetraphosphate (Ap4A) HIT family hydrolase
VVASEGKDARKPMNPTMQKFGYPQTLVREYQYWVVLLRPAQVTLGSLILAAKSDETAYGALPSAAFAEQATVIADIERALSGFVHYDKINYLMLMMVDPNVHFHVIPRYEGSRSWKDLDLLDAGWPGPPQLAGAHQLEPVELAGLRDEMRQSFE